MKNTVKGKSIKKKKINNKKNKGFTLVELLAVIAVLSLIVTIVIYTAMNVIDNAKSNSYKVTINNIQADANSYTLEDFSGYWLAGGAINGWNEYQCVTVQNLIDSGYYDNDVLDSYVNEDRHVLATDYIYLERDSDTKTILKSIWLGNEVNELCLDTAKGGVINFRVSPSGWAKEKTVTIEYNIYNMESSTDLANYMYKYSFIKDSDKEIDDNLLGSGNFSSKTKIEKMVVKENGTVDAYINFILSNGNKKEIDHKNKVISGIDSEGPVITFGTNGSGNNWIKTASSTINVTDNGIGVDNSTLKYVFSTSSTVTPGASFTNGSTVRINAGTGNYYLIVKACDKLGNCTTEVSEPFKIDNIAPTITFGTNGNSTWSKTASSTISATDNNSGVDTNTLKYVFSTNSSATPSSNSFTNGNTVTKSSGSGNFYLVAKACDRAGNCTTIPSGIFKLDNENPDLTISNPKENIWTNTSYNITLSASDDWSGIDYYYYMRSNDNGQYQKYNDSQGKTSYVDQWSAERDENVSFKVCDKAGNCTIKTSRVKIDKTPPTLPNISNPTSGNWTNKDFALTVSTTENGSGVDYWQYGYLNGNWNTYSSSATTSFKTPNFSQERGEKVYIRVRDKAGNYSEQNSTYIRIDKTSPVITCNNNNAKLRENFDAGGTNYPTITKESSCVVSAVLEEKDGKLDNNFTVDTFGSVLSATDPKGTVSSAVASGLSANNTLNVTIINENGDTIDNLMRTYPHCNCDRGYCQWNHNWTVRDLAGNSVTKTFTYKVKYTNVYYGCS